jgi:hypothetical protein
MAKASLGVTQAEFAVAIAEKTSLTHRIAALQDRWKLEDSDSAQRKARSAKSHAKAVQAERAASVAKAELAVAKATLAAVKAGGDKNSATGKALATAQSALKKSYAAASNAIKPDDPYAGLTGAKWTPTRFLFSGKDDPTVPFPVQSTGRRTALAKWITDPRNPLTARVAVNHIWMRHMGAPLVPTVFDFGRNGLSPTHPELLDWLAAEFIDSGWSMKHLHSLIVSSAAYRMSSSLDGGDKSAIADPQNQFWWRRIPMRLESQAIRDAVLTHAGTIDLTMGGPPVLPAQQAASRRRSLYFFHSNNSRNIFLATFDEALVTACYRREQSIVPQQALALANSSFVLDSSKTIAKRLGEGVTEDSQFIRKAFAVLLGIEASALEISKSEQALRSWEILPNGSVDDARANLVWVLINHNDFVTLR